MAYKLEVNHPDFPKGWEFDCDGIAVKNGETVDISAEQEEHFAAKWGQPISDFYRKNGAVAKLTGTSALSNKKEGGE